MSKLFKRIFMSMAAALLLAVVPATGALANGVSGGGASGAVTTASHQEFTLKYVALGDSVAAGLGLAPGAAPSSEDTLCGRSPLAYANTVASAINAKLSAFNLQVSLTNAACQGATTHHLTNPQAIGGSTIQPQLDAAFKDGKPALLSLTIGANDVQWANFIGACFAPTNCDTAENTALADSFIQAMRTRLAGALGDIRARSHFFAPITAVTGYYNPISLQCSNSNFTAGEVAWLTEATDKLNNALRSATEQAGWFARFAPVDFTGHDICSSDPWLQRPGVPGEPAPFHPTARGQQAMADAVLHSLRLQ